MAVRRKGGALRTERLDIKQLPAAVLCQALDDAGLLPATGAPPRGPRTPSPARKWHQLRDQRERAHDRAEAIAFLTGDGEWGLAREVWCDAAGIDPSVFREKVLALLAQARARRLSQVRSRVRPSIHPTQQPTQGASCASPASPCVALRTATTATPEIRAGA